MSRVTIYGPSIRFDHEWHVHKEGCQCLNRSVYTGEDPWTIDAESRKEVVGAVYCNVLEESGATWDEYEVEFKFFPCTKQLATNR